MKKYILILLALPLMLSSCLKNDMDVFGQIPGERLEQFNQEVNKILAEAPNGWVMSYFPGRSLEYGGYKVYMKFDGDGNVTISSEISTWLGKTQEIAAKESEQSLYAMGRDYGPTLNFNTYNTLFHMFSEADVRKTIGTGAPGIGLGGDAEFIIMSADKDKIVLRGKKAQFDVTLTPLPVGQTWEQSLAEYYTAIEPMDEMQACQFEIGGKTYEMARYKDVLFWRAFAIYFSETEILNVSFEQTLTGLKFHDPVVINGVAITEMKWVGNGYLDEASGAKISKIVSDNTFTITVPAVQATKATIAITPTNADEYYYAGVYPKSQEATKTDAELLNELASKATKANFMKGAISGSVSVKPETEYVAFAFGVHEDINGNIVATTGLSKSDSFTTPKDVPASEAYKAWLGTWTVTSTSSEKSAKSFSFDITISEKERNKSYYVGGWSICKFRENPDFFGVGDLQSNGTMTFANEQYLFDINGGAYKLLWTNRFTYTQSGVVKYNTISGGITTMTLTLGANKLGATSKGFTQNHPSLGVITVTGMDYMYFDAEGSYGWYDPAAGFGDGDFLVGPYTLTKKSGTPVAPPRGLAIKKHVNYVVNATKYMMAN